MTTTFRLNADELDESFLKKLKVFFEHEEVEISVTALDATAELLADPDDRARIARSIKHLQEHEGLVDFDIDSERESLSTILNNPKL